MGDITICTSIICSLWPRHRRREAKLKGAFVATSSVMWVWCVWAFSEALAEAVETQAELQQIGKLLSKFTPQIFIQFQACCYIHILKTVTGENMHILQFNIFSCDLLYAFIGLL